jgi:tetratricopeptide (TPR) repeat protein
MPVTNRKTQPKPADIRRQSGRKGGAELSLCRYAFLAVPIAIVVVVVTPVGAQDGDAWIGKRVVPRQRGLTLRDNDEAVEPKARTLDIYRVKRVDGPLLWLKAEIARTSGWAAATDVVPVEQAAAFFTAQILTHPRDAFAYSSRGFIHFEKNELELAIGDYNEALRLYPKDSAACCGRGNAWLRKKQYDKAVADFDLALGLDAKNTIAFIGRGESHGAVGAHTKAIADFSEAIWLDPLSLVAYYDRGNAWQAKKESAKAIIDYNVAIRLDPEHGPAYLKRAVAWEALQKYEQALADYDEAVRIDPRCALAHRGSAWLRARCSDLTLLDRKKAVESATKACKLTDWKDAASLDVLAAACAASGDFESAVSWQTKALALDFGDHDKAERERCVQRYRDRKPLEPIPLKER